MKLCGWCKINVMSKWGVHSYHALGLKITHPAIKNALCARSLVHAPLSACVFVLVYIVHRIIYTFIYSLIGFGVPQFRVLITPPRGAFSQIVIVCAHKQWQNHCARAIVALVTGTNRCRVKEHEGFPIHACVYIRVKSDGFPCSLSDRPKLTGRSEIWNCERVLRHRCDD